MVGLELSHLGKLQAEITASVSLTNGMWATILLDWLSWLRCRQLLKTNEGRFGFTKRGVQPTDISLILAGSCFCACTENIEKVENGERTRQFVEDAYLHGLRHGEGDELGIERTGIVLE